MQLVVSHAGLASRAPQAMLPTGACLMSIGGLSYHMGQFHVAQLFPENRGLISSLYVGTFIASGIIFEIVRVIHNAAGSSMRAFRSIMIVLGMLGMAFVPLMLWMAPAKTFVAGQNYKFDRRSFRFLVEHVQKAPPQDADDSSSICSGDQQQKITDRSLIAECDLACVHCKNTSSCRDRRSLSSQRSNSQPLEVTELPANDLASSLSKQEHDTAAITNATSSGLLPGSCKPGLGKMEECEPVAHQATSPVKIGTSEGTHGKCKADRWVRPRRGR
jgi:hypothetical protein